MSTDNDKILSDEFWSEFSDFEEFDGGVENEVEIIEDRILAIPDGAEQSQEDAFREWLSVIEYDLAETLATQQMINIDMGLYIPVEAAIEQIDFEKIRPQMKKLLEQDRFFAIYDEWMMACKKKLS